VFLEPPESLLPLLQADARREMYERLVFSSYLFLFFLLASLPKKKSGSRNGMYLGCGLVINIHYSSFP
jgi:hypothetical protein